MNHRHFYNDAMMLTWNLSMNIKGPSFPPSSSGTFLVSDTDSGAAQRVSSDLEMVVLQRSVATFRRSGSSGLVWDDRFLESLDQKTNIVELQGDDNLVDIRELRPSHSVRVSHQSNKVEHSHRSGASPGLPLPPSKSFGSKIFTVIKRTTSAKQPMVSSQ